MIPSFLLGLALALASVRCRAPPSRTRTAERRFARNMAVRNWLEPSVHDDLRGARRSRITVAILALGRLFARDSWRPREDDERATRSIGSLARLWSSPGENGPE